MNTKTESVERISILPSFSAETAKELDEVVKKKANLEYLCRQMLKALDDAGLQRILELAANHEIIDEEIVHDFYGSKHDPDSGCCAADGYTVKALLEEWDSTTERMLKIVSGGK